MAPDTGGHRSHHRHAPLFVLALAASIAACPIPEDDLLPGIGAPCVLDEGLCPLEHACRPSEAGAADGLCAPVATFGGCEAPTHPPGRFGDVKDGDVVVDQEEDLPDAAADLRVVQGDVRVRRGGVPALAIGDLCVLRALQAVAGSVVVGNTDLASTDGLQSLTSVGRGLALIGNADLATLDGFASLAELAPCRIEGRDIHAVIARNPRLPRLEVERFVEKLEARTGAAVTIVACENEGLGDACGVDQAPIVQALQDGEGCE
jgi:hypothetical protein